MKPATSLLWPAVPCLAGILLAACSILPPRPDPSRLFVLDAAAGSGQAARATKLPAGVSVGFGPVDLPDYLKRPELVTRRSATEISPSPTDRWAEPLDAGVARVLALDLAARLGVSRLEPWPWYATQRPDCQVALSFERFERDSDGNAVLVAVYHVRDLRPGGRSVSREARFEKAPAGADTSSLVAALGAVLDDLSLELATALTELDPQP